MNPNRSICRTTLLATTSLTFACLSAGATTLVHYPMENLEKKSYAAGSVIPDASPTGSHPATLAEYVYGTQHKYYAPVAEAPTGLSGNGICDGGSGVTLHNGTVLTFTQPNDKVDGNGAALRIEESADDTSLHLQSFTVEFMWACAVNSRWASPVSRLRVDSSNPPTGTGTDASTCTFYVSKSSGVWKALCITTVQGGGGFVTKTSDLGSAEDIVNGNWHHLALTLDETTHKLALYVDGVERGSVVLDGPLVYQNGNPWVFGGHGYYGWQAGGSMDEIRISDRVLAPSEFLQFASLPDVLARYSMEATAETSFQIGDTFPNRSEADETPLTVCDIVHSSAMGYYTAGKHQYFAPQGVAAFDAPFNAVQEGIGGRVETNDSALVFTQPMKTGSDGHGATLQVKDAAGRATYHLQEFTIEYFWKARPESHWAAPLSRTRVDASGNPLGTTDNAGQNASTLTFYLDENDRLQCIYSAQGVNGVVTETKKICDGCVKLFSDNAWHHHAVTLNAYTHQLVYYVDGKSVGSLTLPGPLVYEPGNAWSFGGYGYYGWQAGGTMDEIRISPYVRTPETFLRQTFSTPAKGALAHFTLDGDFKSIDNTELNPDDATVSAIVAPLLESGNLAFGTDRPGGRFVDGNGNKIRARNRESLTVSNLIEAGLVLPATTYRLDLSNGLTCEFFAKATSDGVATGSWAVLFVLGNADLKRFPICFQENGQGLLNLRVDTDQTMYRAISSKASPFDGNWHHIACTMQLTSDVKSTLVSYYIDGELQGAATIPGKIPELTPSFFEIGTRAQAMQIDEIRLSNGVLDVVDFMQPCPPAGMILTVR